MAQQDTSRAVVPLNKDAAVATGATPVQSSMVPGLDFAQITPDIIARAAAIAADVAAQGGQISGAAALAAAYHFAETGEVMGRHAYVGTRGQVTGRVLEGYRGVVRNMDTGKYQYRYRPMNDEERELHGILPGDRSLICELDVLAARRRCIEMRVPYEPVIGITVIRKSEPLNVPKNRTAYWVLCKQARNDALRQVGENVTAGETLDEIRSSGETPEFDVTVPDAQLVAGIQAELLRTVAAAQIDGLSDAARAAVLETMRVSAYGASPAQSPAEGVTLGGLGINVQPAPAASVSDVVAVIERIRADAKTRDGDGSHKLSAATHASAWDKLRLLDWEKPHLTVLVRALFGTDDFTTPGQAAAVFYWLRQEGDKTVVNPTAQIEATAILAAQELDVEDAPEPEDKETGDE